MNKAVFFDRDGTIAEDAGYCRRPEDFILFPKTPEVIKALKRHGFKVVLITNQSGIGRGIFSEGDLAGIHKKMKADLDREGARFDGIYYCPHRPDENCACRKPKIELILRAVKDLDIDLKNSFVVGDLPKDVEMGKAAGCHTILIGQPVEGSPESSAPDVVVPGIADVLDVVLTWPEHGNKRKKTS